MTAYYNENDPFAAQWLRNLIAEGHIAPGDVDERSIEEVQPDDLKKYRQCHFFAGIGGWSLALRLAGWPDDRPVWTASCPCPPFSAAGKRQVCPCCAGGLLVWCPGRTGFAVCADCGNAWLADPRHLWPEARRLVAVCRPAVVFGEQVAAPEGLVWLAGVRSSLEICGYALGSADMPAAGVGSPNIRQRLFWVADAEDADRRRELEAERTGRGRHRSGRNGKAGGMAYADGGESRKAGPIQSGGEYRQRPENAGTGQGLVDAFGAGLERHAGNVAGRDQPGRDHTETDGSIAPTGFDGIWRRVPILCDDGKWRGVPCDKAGNPERALFPVADARSVRNRLGLLRGSGNAINPWIASEFIRAYDGDYSR